MSKQQVKVVCIGAAVQDVFLRGRIFEPHKDDDGDKVEEFALGTKNDVEAITISTGGGATNASVTFARHEFRSYYLGKIGKDVSGRVVLEDLRSNNVDTSLVGYHETLGTGYSTILLSPNGERTILTYRGASADYKLSQKDFYNVAPDWFYVSSLSGEMEALQTIVEFAQKHDIKIAVNPGKGELKNKTAFLKLCPAFSILSLNKEEAEEVFDGKNGKELALAASKLVPVALITDGPKGSIACDGQRIYKAGIYEDVPVIDRAGAGDAFSSGFVARIADGGSIEQALTFASANSTSVVGQIGAKVGILTKDARLHHMEVKTVDVPNE